ncbi:MAG TPA: LysE family translocator [Burkholderiaceae bacterium]
MNPAATPDLWLFFILVFGIIVLPGMDMAFVAGSALTSGLRGGLVAVAGIVAAGVVHVAVGASGIAALLLWWPAAFNILLLAGAAYMVWIGLTLWRASHAVCGAAGAADTTTPKALRTIFGRAALTCLLNPKAYAFTLAVFPAFLRSAEYTLAEQAMRMGAVIAGTQALVYGAVAVFVASARRWSGAGERGQRWTLRGVSATLMLGAVLTLLFAWRPVAAG